MVDGTDNNGIAAGFEPVPGSCSGTPPVIASLVPAAAICSVNGTITVNYSGGYGPYTIAWSGSGSGTDTDTDGSPYIISVPSGTYTITITDSYGSFTTAGPVTVPYQPVTNLSSTPTPTYYSTIQGAINAATAGDVIYICDGTYNERVVVNKSLTLRGQSEAGTIMAVS